MKVTTKEKILRVAGQLFYTHGYNGTAIRAIAKEAQVNVSLVSYHFGSKLGLYEQLITDFFEGYIAEIKKEVSNENKTAKKRLISTVKSLLLYQSSNHYVARMAHREMTLDSTLVRELMMTYSRKEIYDYKRIIQLGINNGEFLEQPLDYIVIHLRTMFIMPFLSPHYLQELYQLTPRERYFVDRYMEYLERWIYVSLARQTK